MVFEKFIDGYENFRAFMADFKPESGKNVNILFTGKEIGDGKERKSWCSDCVEAKPYIKAAVDRYAGDSYFLTVDVGDRPTWKDLNCKFRKDPDTRLMVIPTLIRWKNPQRLEGDQLLKDDLLQMFFEDDS